MSAEVEPVSPLSEGDRKLVADVLAIADDLGEQHFLGTGTLRQAARRLTELAAGSPRCEACGEPIPRAKLERGATYCSDRCRLRAWRLKRHGDNRG